MILPTSFLQGDDKGRGRVVPQRALRRAGRCAAALVLGGLLGWQPAAHALGDAAWGYSWDFTHDWIQSDLTRRSAEQWRAAVNKRGGSKGRQARPLLPSPLDIGDAGDFVSSRKARLSDTRAVEALAARLYPREDYRKSRHMFEGLIVAFNRNVDAQYGVPKNNLATGMAVALAGGYAAYTNQAFPDAMVKPLVTQLDGLLREDSKVTSMGIRQKVYTYHMMVGTGLWLTAMQIDLQRQPDARRAAALRRAGGDYLQALLGVAPDRVSFTSAGLQMQ